MKKYYQEIKIIQSNQSEQVLVRITKSIRERVAYQITSQI